MCEFNALPRSFRLQGKCNTAETEAQRAFRNDCDKLLPDGTPPTKMFNQRSFGLPRTMRRKWFFRVWLVALILATVGMERASAQRQQTDDSEFGPVVRAYLGYLKNEQEVVDDRNSRHEIKRSYYIRNSNRIRALRQMAIRIARESDNDYLPELEAAAQDELGNIFEYPPKPASLIVGEVYNHTFRFLGAVRSGDVFYIFARLDPYEQAELMNKEKTNPDAGSTPDSAPASTGDEMTSRPRKVGTP
jgi:hypothetical protein